MFLLTCSVEKKFIREGGVSYLLRPVRGDGIDDYSVDIERTHVQAYFSGQAVEALADRRLEIEDLKRTYDFDPETGGYQLVLGKVGNFFISVFLGERTGHWVEELERLLSSTILFLQIEVGDELSRSDRHVFDQWLKGERFEEDAHLFAGKLPSLSVVKKVVP